MSGTYADEYTEAAEVRGAGGRDEEEEGSSGGDENGDSNGYVHVNPSSVAAGTSEEEVSVFVEPVVDQVDHTGSSDEVLVNASDSSQNDSDDVRVAEDGGREDMFVDCPDEIETSETQQNSEERDEVQDTGSTVVDSGAQVHELVAEVENLRYVLDNTIAEKESIVRVYKEERVLAVQELARLHFQVQALNDQQFSGTKTDEELLDHPHETDIGNDSEEIWGSDASLPQMINYCSHSLKYALDQRLQTGDILSRILDSLGTAVHEYELSDGSVTGKLAHAEKCLSLLVQKYNVFLSEIDQVRWCLNEISPDLDTQDEVGIFVHARDKLTHFRKKELDLEEKLSRVEGESIKLAEQLDNHNEVIEKANAEIRKLNAEVEQERTKYSNTKEKLSLAVTKGKALVQQRDSLKQLVAEKTRELDKCLSELQEKATALEAAEQVKEYLVKTENLTASLQEDLSQKDTILQKCAEILSETVATEEVQVTNIIEMLRLLADERSEFKSISLEFHKIRDSLSAVDFPDTVQNLDARIGWLVQSLYLAKEESLNLKDQITGISEAAKTEIDRLTSSLLVETQEKNYLQEALDDLRSRYETVVEKEYQHAMANKRLIGMLLEASGFLMDVKDDAYHSQSDMVLIVEKCLTSIKEKATDSLESSHVFEEIFGRVQNHLYMKNMEMALYEELLEEEMLDKSKVEYYSNQLVAVTQELHLLKDEKENLQKDLERLEDKTALLREKLSMAVKKGKGLVQERENLKGTLDDKNNEIDKLKLEIQRHVSALNDSEDKISQLSANVERIPTLEADLVATTEKRDQLEKFLVESNSMLQSLIESIDNVALPDDSVSSEPVEKVKWLAWHFTECQTAKALAQEELEKVKDEVSNLAMKLGEAQTAITSLEDALSLAETRATQLLQENKELETAKKYVEEELQKATEDATSRTSELAELCATRKSIEDALALAENSISMLTSEKEDALASKAAAEMELHKIEEQFSTETSKLAEANNTIQALEGALAEAQKNISLLAEENDKVNVSRTDLENEMQKLKEDFDSQASKHADVSSTLRSLENALSDAEKTIFKVTSEKQDAEQEIVLLNSKLNASTQELAGKHDSSEDISLELSGHVSNLQLLLTDGMFSSNLEQSLGRTSDRLKDINLLLKEMNDYLLEIDSEMLDNDPVMKDYLSMSALPLPLFDNVSNMEMVDCEVNTADVNNILLRFGKTVEGFRLRENTLADKFGRFSTVMDDLLQMLRKNLQATNDRVKITVDLVKSLKQKLDDVESVQRDEEKTIVEMEGDIRFLVSACVDATQQLEAEAEKNFSELASISELKILDYTLLTEQRAGSVDSVPETQPMQGSSKYVKTTEKLFFAVTQSRELRARLQNLKDKIVSASEEFQNKLEEAKFTCEKLSEERYMLQNRISKLENELEASKNLCNEMRHKVEERTAELESKFKDKEVELEEIKFTCEELLEERVLHQNRISKLVGDVEASENLCNEMRIKLDNYCAKEDKFKDTEAELDRERIACEELRHEKELYRNRVSELETEIRALENSCNEMSSRLEDYQAKEDKFKEKEPDSSSLAANSSLARDAEDSLLSPSQLKSLFDKIDGFELPATELGGEEVPHNSDGVRKLLFLVDNFTGLQQQVRLLSGDKEEFLSTLDKRDLEIEHLKEEVEEYARDRKFAERLKNELLDLESSLKNIIQKLSRDESFRNQKVAGAAGLLLVLDELVSATMMESESLKVKTEDLTAKLVATQKLMDDLSGKVKLLEDSNASRLVPADTIQDKGIFEAASLPMASEISEIQEMGLVGKNKTIPSATSAAHARTLRKGSSDHLAISIDSESERLINKGEVDEDKGHVFKSLNTSGLIPVQGKMIADRIDGIWVSGGRALTSRPRARLGVIAYCLLLHIWLLGTIL